jgi:flagellin
MFFKKQALRFIRTYLKFQEEKIMRIQHNIAALNANRMLGANNTAVSKNLEKLSSGYKINRAGDDAAGLAISEKMRGQIRGLDQATNNANDGISLVQTAEGALNETASILQRMKELATQSSNGTYQNAVDRENISKEVASLKSEIDRISTSTNFNKINLLDGSLSEAGAAGSNTIAGVAVDISGLEAGTQVVFAKHTGAAAASWNATNKTLTLNLDDTVNNYSSAQITALMNSAAESGAPKTGNAKFTGVISATGAVAGTVTVSKATQGKVTTASDINAGFSLDVAKLGKTGIADITFASAANTSSVGVAAGGHMTITLDSNKTYSSDDINNLLKASGYDAFHVGFDGSKSVTDIVAGYHAGAAIGISDGSGVLGGKGLTLQIGANGTSDQQVSLNIGDMSSAGLGISNVSVASQDDAKAAISTIDDAINKVSSTRADLGALQNRLEHTVSNLGVTSENLSSAESRIRDVDMAKEMMDMTKNNVLAQAAQSMLAQANQQPQNVLKLLQ